MGGLLLAAVAQPVLAHPHVFIDAGIKVMFDTQGRVDALELSWTYDEFYTLMIEEERHLDSDGDGVLTDAETASLQGFDMDWQAGYPGDTYVLLGKEKVAISGPSDWTAKIEGGKVTSTHMRKLLTPVRPGTEPLIIQSYDPDYYFAYTIVSASTGGSDEGCNAVIYGFDPATADAALAAASAEYMASGKDDAEFPKIGAAYADEVRVGCS
jgi:polyphosphate kinase